MNDLPCDSGETDVPGPTTRRKLEAAYSMMDVGDENAMPPSAERLLQRNIVHGRGTSIPPRPAIARRTRTLGTRRPFSELQGDRARKSANVASQSCDQGKETRTENSSELRGKENIPAVEHKQECIVPIATSVENDGPRRSPLGDNCDLSADVIGFLRKQEIEERLDPSRLEQVQFSITGRMRRLLVDWLVKVNHKFRLSNATLFLSIRLIDECLSRQPIDKDRLQLLGITALFVAAKYEQIWPPSLSKLLRYTGRSFNQTDVKDLESFLLKTINYKMVYISASQFILPFLKAVGEACERVLNLSNYLIELLLMEPYVMYGHRPSQLAAAAVWLALRSVNSRSTTTSRPWNETVGAMPDLSENRLQPAIWDVHSVWNRTTDRCAITIKNGDEMHLGVASITLYQPTRPVAHCTRGDESL